MGTGNERLNQSRLAELVAGTRFERVRWLESTGSTNQDLVEASDSGAGEQVLIADFQSAGRGRRDRTWVAPPGSGLLMSLLIRPGSVGEPDRDPFWTVAAIGLATAQAIDGLVGSGRCRLKWPNDLEIDGAKVAGILAHTSTPAHMGSPGLDGAALVVGLGINANWTEDHPRVGDRPATAISLAGASPVDRVELAAAILTGAAAELGRRPDLTVAEWKQACSTIGARVRVELADSTALGIAVDVDDGGALVIDHGGEGGPVAYHVGDVTHLRPSE